MRVETTMRKTAAPTTRNCNILLLILLCQQCIFRPSQLLSTGFAPKITTTLTSTITKTTVIKKHQSNQITNIKRRISSSSPLPQKTCRIKCQRSETKLYSVSSSSLTPRNIAARALIQTPKSKSKQQKQKNNDSPVTKLESNPSFQNLVSKRDKAFCRNIVSTTTRRIGQIHKVLGVVCDSKYPPKCGKYTGIVAACLQMGTAQILFMDGVKDFAAVKETVSVLKYYYADHDGGNDVSKLNQQKQKQQQTPEKLVKFVNAILRRITREGQHILCEETVCTDNISPWLLKEWNGSYGEETTLKIVQHLLDDASHAHVDLSLKHLNEDHEVQDIVNKFEAMGENHGSITLLPNHSLRVKKGSETIVANYPLYNEGRWWVQDVSSTLPAIGLISAFQQKLNDRNFDDDNGNGDSYDVGVGSDYFEKLHIVDMCAAPGGKTSQLLAAGFGKVTAIEVNNRRCRRLKENLNRLGLREKCKIVISAGQDWAPLPNERVDAVLLDVPCSATGTGNRRPDVLQKDMSDLESLLKTQETLANHVLDNCLPKGGVMVYATCSLLSSESEDQVMKLLEREDVETIPFTPGEIPGFDGAIDKNGWLRVLPGVLGGHLNFCDGFFVARLKKV